MSNIEWTDETWNPTTGCTPVSPGCLNCYAAVMARRLEAMGQKPYVGLTVKHNGRATFNGKLNVLKDRLTIPLKWKKPRRIFVNSMSDLFHEDVPFDFIDKASAVMALCPQHTFQILTKRPERMAEYVPGVGHRIYRQVSKWLDEGAGGFLGRQWDAAHELAGQSASGGIVNFTAWNAPLPNVWLGCSIENQKTADERIPHLLRVPAAVRFLSYEPALEGVDLMDMPCLPANELAYMQHVDPLRGWYSDRPGKCGAGCSGPKIDWVIVGGESGPNARPCNIEWLRSIIGQCKAAGVACFVKQLGAKPVEPMGAIANLELNAFGGSNEQRFHSLSLLDPKGGDMSEWAADLRVREMPEMPEVRS